MTLRAIFGGVIAKLRLRKKDSVQQLAEELYTALTSDEPIVLTGRIIIHNPTNGPAITVVNTGDVDHQGIEVSDKSGRTVVLGLGHGSTGIYANNFQFRPEFRSDPDAAQELLAQIGERGGDITLTPATSETTPGTPVGPGAEATTGFTADAVGSGYAYGKAGTGVPGVVNPASVDHVPVPGLGEMLGSIQRSNRDGHGGKPATHSPNVAHLLTLNSNPLWWPKDLHGWMPNRCTVDKDYGDWLECTRYDIDDVVKVTKPYWLQRTPFDGKTVDGVSYVYTSNQCRTATDSSGSEVQVVHPPYRVKSGYTAGDIIYARWVSNGTNVVGAEYIDINVDARTWVASPSGCTQSSLDAGGDTCEGGSCDFKWNGATYDQTSDKCDAGWKCPAPPLTYEGDDINICCNLL